MKRAFHLLCLACFTGAALLRAAPASTPNIVLILADDLGVGSVNCYHASTNLVRTPTIDRLAHEGRRFTDACTPASVCSPVLGMSGSITSAKVNYNNET